MKWTNFGLARHQREPSAGASALRPLRTVFQRSEQGL